MLTFTHPEALRRFDLSGRSAWVVGGAGLLGTAVSTALAQHGAHVIVSDIRAEPCNAVVDAIRSFGGSAEAQVIDVSKEADIVRTADAVFAARNRLDVVVNLAWFYTKTPMEQMTTTEWEKGMSVTLTGAFLIGREAARLMRPHRRGSIVQFSSMYGIISPDPNMYGDQPINPIDYGVAKAGVLQMVRYQAVMLARDNVRVNAIVPGPFPNPAGQGGNAPFVSRLTARIPMARVGHPDEITGAVVFLASDASTYVTGTKIVIDGGWTAW